LRRPVRAMLASLLVMVASGAGLVWWFVIRDDRPSAPADIAAQLVPARALAYLHLSTDPERDADAALLSDLQSFPGIAALRTRAVGALGRDFDLNRDVRPWLGDEVGVALLDAGGTVADALAVLAVRDRPKAELFLTRVAGAQGAAPYRGIPVQRFGPLSAAFARGFLIIGQDAAVREALDRSAGRGPRLADAPTYRRATEGRPAGRSIDLFLSSGGVRRVLAAAPGLVGAVGGLLDHPRLTGVSASFAHADEGLRLTVRQARAADPPREFSPRLVDEVPRAATAYLGLAGLDSVGQLFTGAQAKALRRPLDQALRSAALDLDRDILAPLRGEVAFSLTPGLPVPTATLVARTSNPGRTREALARLQQPLAEILAAPAQADGPAPAFEQRDLGGTAAFVLAVAPGVDLSYAVAKDLLIISTQPNGVGQVLADRASVADTDAFKRVVGEKPERASAVLFLDLGQLLALADQAGLTGDPAYAAVRDDLSRVRHAGVVIKREETDTTAELFLETS
jgi:hypothetical protein